MADSQTLIYPATDLTLAIQALREGKLVAIPTETVYGLAADATNDQAIASIYALKKRPQFNPLIVHVDSIERATTLAQWNKTAQRLAEVFWPGPLTFILPRRPSCAISPFVSAGLETLAIRMPSHPVAQRLIAGADCPLAAPSANPSEALSPTTAKHVWEAFKDNENCPLIIDGGSCVVGIESTIIDLTTSPTVLRWGSVPPEELEKVIGSLATSEGAAPHQPKAPGQMHRHYAPHHRLRLNATSVYAQEALLAFGPNPLKGACFTLNLSSSGNLVEATANLFAMLHQLDQIACQTIAVMPIPAMGLGLAINDRLYRGSQEA